MRNYEIRSAESTFENCLHTEKSILVTVNIYAFVPYRCPMERVVLRVFPFEKIPFSLQPSHSCQLRAMKYISAGWKNGLSDAIMISRRSHFRLSFYRVEMPNPRTRQRTN